MFGKKKVKTNKNNGLKGRSKRDVWNKAETIEGKNPRKYRIDEFGYEMEYRYYGRKDKRTGWHRDHSYPKKKGGDNSLDNSRPMTWFMNEWKSDKVLPRYKDSKNKK